VLVSPSILSADWTRLPDELRAVETGGADWLHCDVMDGHFVPNLTFGPDFVATLGRMTRLPLDVHLMIEEPQPYFEAFARAGARLVTVHPEARGVAGPGWPVPAAVASHHALDLGELARTLAGARAAGLQVGLALRPDTALEEVEPVLGELDLLLVMTVYPGFSGQAFLDDQLPKIQAAARWKREHAARWLLEVDGGVTAGQSGVRVAEAGAEIVVAGHGIFRQPDRADAVRALKRLS
jgi:ribulose-phosphate 3-epimerase